MLAALNGFHPAVFIITEIPPWLYYKLGDKDASDVFILRSLRIEYSETPSWDDLLVIYIRVIYNLHSVPHTVKLGYEVRNDAVFG